MSGRLFFVNKAPWNLGIWFRKRGMTFGRKAVMPGEGKQGNGMTLGREAVMPGEGKGALA